MAFAGDFGDLHDDEPNRPPLPPEDRLWRHPSELGRAHAGLPLDPVAVRRRWLSSQPSRASAWSAGLAGALLATGLVALGTHLASALAAHPSARAAVGKTLDATTLATAGATGPLVATLGSSIRSPIERVGASVARITVADNGLASDRLGIVVSSGGLVLTSCYGVTRSSALTVTLQGETYVGSVLGTDKGTGLAVVRVRPSSALPTARLEAAADPSIGDIVFAIASTDELYLGTVRRVDMSPHLAGTTLIDAIETDVPGSSPLGAAVLDPAGALVGIVTARSGDYSYVIPAWLAAAVARDLANAGIVAHGWLGVDASTEGGGGVPSGVRLWMVAPSGAAAHAGLRVGDEILAVDGTRVTSLPALKGRLYALAPGTRADLTIARGPRRMTVTAVLDATSSS